MFFTFADHYYYLNEKQDFNKIPDDVLFDQFQKYLEQEKYVYHSEAEKQIDKMIADVNARKVDGTLSADLDRIKREFDNLDKTELKIYKDEILREIKGELAARFLGNNGRTEVYLKYDKQFEAALGILNDTTVYNNLLR